MSGTLLPPAPVMQGNQMMGGGGMPSSALAASLMRGSMPLNLQSPTNGIPLASILTMLMNSQGSNPGATGPGIGAVLNGAGGGDASSWGQSPGFFSGIGNGLSNLLQGQPWGATGSY